MHQPVPCQQCTLRTRWGSANCRIMLDWEFNGYPPDEQVYEHRCVLVSTCKTEKGHEWRLDRAFAERSALGEESAEESVSEEEEEPARTRPKRTPGGRSEVCAKG